MISIRQPVLLWLGVFVYLNCAGWLLSAADELNSAGYALALALGAVILVVYRHHFFYKVPSPFFWKKLCRRFQRPFPALFLFIAILTFIGGLLYAPDNYDALTYRLPRMLSWWTAGHWYWIHTFNNRMNFSAPGWEWTAMPQLVLLHSDRGLFLINLTGFLLLPGLVFSVLRRLGATWRVAWTWMWILPLTYGYVLQAGSIGNDLTGAIFSLVAVDFALRARTSRKVSDVWWCGMAAALMTGNKLSDLPLLLPCLVAVWPALPLLRKHWAGTAMALLLAAFCSGLPIMALNQMHAGHWSGDPDNSSKMQLKNPVAGLLGNGLLLADASLQPPLFPGSRQIHERVNQHLPGSWQRLLADQFPHYKMASFPEFPIEEGAGLGLGITLPLLIALAVAVCGWGGNITNGLSWRTLFSVGFAAWVALLFYMVKMGSEGTGRLLLPYYPLAIAPCC